MCACRYAIYDRCALFRIRQVPDSYLATSVKQLNYRLYFVMISVTTSNWSERDSTHTKRLLCACAMVGLLSHLRMESGVTMPINARPRNMLS